MFRSLFTLVAVVWFVATFTSCTQQNKPTNFVDPFIGTGGHGHTFPGATLPFGMIQVSPDTRLDGWDGCSGYHFSDTIVYGFSHTHLSGTGCTDYGDILLMPTTGEILLSNGKNDHRAGYASVFEKTDETASPGFYSTQLKDYNIGVELSATLRAGIHKYSYPSDEEQHVIIDLEHRDKVLDAAIEVSGTNEVSGYRFSQMWADDQRLYFVIQFSEPIADFGIASDDQILKDKKSATGLALKGYFSFPPSEKPLIAKIGISAVSIENARLNLTSEIPNWDFKKVKNDAENTWNRALSKIEISDENSSHSEVFYTALYHTMIAPNLYTDINGEYRGRDMKIHTADGWTNYTVFSLWDTYRAAHPLYTLIEQKRSSDFINTFIHQWEQGGLLPVWELSGCETNCMIGYHAVPVIADAYLKGIRDFDNEKALEAMITSALQDDHGLEFYKAYGYIPAGEEGESVSKTLEYAYDDWCIAQMAKEMGKDDLYVQFIKRAQSYKNLFDPTTNFIRARQNADWFTPFDPTEVNFNYTEANGWQYNFYVPQDINSHITLMGGDEAYCARLDEMFTASSSTTGREQADITGLIGQYAHGNEPSHHMAFLYNYAGKPWKTQTLTREILTTLYTPEPDGLCGNEDCGQMSAWYVMSAMGLYPVTPGDNNYALTSPLFNEVKINLESGKQFKISAKNNSPENCFIQSVKLNGKPLEQSFISHNTVISGGVLEFVMGNEPNYNWGANVSNRPKSTIEEHLITPSPYIASGINTFLENTTIDLGCIEKDAEIYFTTDKNSPQEQWKLWEKPLTVKKSTTIYAFAAVKDRTPSPVIEMLFHRIPKGRTIASENSYPDQYSAGGKNALIDGLRGSNNFKTGRWQGYYDQDFEAVVDLSKNKKINTITIGFIQDQGAWVFFPSEVTFYTSTDGKQFQKVETLASPYESNPMENLNHDFSTSTNRKARYVKVTAKNMGACPEWHLGAGGATWLFADEIVIK